MENGSVQIPAALPTHGVLVLFELAYCRDLSPAVPEPEVPKVRALPVVPRRWAANMARPPGGRFTAGCGCESCPRRLLIPSTRRRAEEAKRVRMLARCIRTPFPGQHDSPVRRYALRHILDHACRVTPRGKDRSAMLPRGCAAANFTLTQMAIMRMRPRMDSDQITSSCATIGIPGQPLSRLQPIM